MPRRSAPGPLARSIGARVRHLREEAHITQEKLAWDCGFAKGFLSQVEAGKSVPSLAALVALARRLGVDPVVVLATDPRKPLHLLVDAVHRADWAAVHAHLALLEVSGLASVPGKPKAAETPRSGSKSRGGKRTPEG